MKRLALFLVLLLALSVAADYTTNVTVVETVDSPALETPTPTESVNVTVIEETVPTEVPFAPSKETVLPTDSPTEIPTEKPTESAVEETPVATEAPTSIPTIESANVPFGPGTTAEPTEVPTKVPTETPVPTEMLAAADVFTQETLGTTNETPIPTEAATEAPTSIATDAPTEAPTSIPTEVPAENTTNTTLVDAVITDADGKVVDAVVAVYDSNSNKKIDSAIQTEEKQEQLAINTSVVDAYIAPINGPVEDIVFDNVKITDENSLALGIDEPQTINEINGAKITRVYAIDPTAMEFDEALVTAVAEGTSLYKCKAWNFDERRCDGDWVLLRTDLTLGAEYEFTLTADDPAFAEGIRTALRIYADAGANPNVTAVVTDGVGIGVPGVLVDFASSAGVMTPSSGFTGPDGTVNSTQSGGAINNTITVNATGLTTVRMNTSTATAAAVTSESIIWFDNSTQTIKGANVNLVTRVLSSGTVAFTVTPVAGSLLNPATISVGATVSQTLSSIISTTQVWHNTYVVGDSIQVDATSGPATPDFLLTMPDPPVYHLFAYAIAGANPTVTAVVTGVNGTGIPNVTVNFSSSAGAMTPSTGLTGVNGTISSMQSGGAVGDTINVTANISGTVLQMKQIVTAAASPAVAASSRVIAWRDNTTNLISVAVVDTTAASRYVLSATGVVTATALDRTPYNDVNISVGSFVSQAAPAIGSVRIAPFTYGSGDVVQITVATTTPVNDQAITLTKYNRTFLEVFAISGSNPNVTAVVTDENGLPVSNVTVNFSASAGAMSITSGLTNPDGTLTSIQTGGALGNTINVTFDAQQQTVTAAVSAAVAAADLSFGWYDRVNRTWHIATVTNTNRVLVTASVVAVAPLDHSPDNDGTAAVSTVVAQAGTREALVRVAQGTTVNNDSLQATVGTTTYATDVFVNLPDDANRYLYAFATAAANPNVTVIVADQFGNGVPGVTVNFTSSAGTLSVTSAVTNASGMANFSQAGGAAGDIINVSSSNISLVTIATSASAAVAAADYVYAWFMPDANRSRSAAVTRANNVLASGTTTTFVPIDNTPDNNLSIVVNRTSQQTTFNSSASNVTDFAANDIITVSVLTTNAAEDAILVLNTSTPVSNTTRTQNRTRLSAYASSGLAGGANPNVTAVVTDAYGYGVSNITVNFSASAGTMTPATAVTGPDGTAKSVQTGGATGNRINVTSFNLSQVNITASPAIAIAANSTSIAWYDANQTELMVAVVSPNGTLVSGTITPTFTLFDETDLNQVSFSVGTTDPQIAPQNISITQVWRRTFNEGDMVFVETATTAASPEAVIVLRTDSRNQLFAYATDGASPNITAIVTDPNGVGVPNVTVNFTAQGGSVPQGNVTGVDGTVTIVQTGGAVGDNITVFTTFQNLTVTTAVTPAVAASSRSIVWLDNTTNIVRAATVSTALASRNVLTATGVVTVTNIDNTPLNNVTFSSGSIVSQATPNVGTTRIAQGTYGTGDILSVSIATTTPALDGAVTTTQFNRTFIDAFATSGANPVVIAYVHDVFGMPVEGILVNFSSSAGTMTPASNLTDHRGIATSSQSGGVVGDVINVTLDGLNPVRIVTAVSVAIAAADKVFAIYDPRTRITQVASVTNANNVLTSASAVTPTAMDSSFAPGAFSLSTVLAQSTAAAASFRVSPVTEAIHDGLSIAVATTTAAVDAYLTLGAPTGRYLYAFANGGANPNVTAVVTDENGVALFGIPITFTASAGTLSTTLNTTNTSGMATATQAGGALGDTIVVTSPGLTNVTITTAASAAIAAADVIIPWFDPEFALVRSAAVTRANNVLTTVSAQNYLLTDNTPFNNATASNRTTLTQNANRPSQELLNSSAIADGDFVTLFTTTATPAVDGLVFVNMSTAPTSNISISKSDFPDPVAAGSQLNYTITINSTGNGTAFNIIVTESYPSGVVFHNSSPNFSVTNTTFRLNNTSPGNVTTVNITVNVSSALGNGTILNNSINVSFENATGSTFTLNTSETTTVIGVAKIITNKSDSPDPVQSGSTLSYTILINNTGEEIAYNITVVESYPANVTFNGSEPAPFSGNDTFVIGNLLPNDSFLINITVNVSSPNGSVLNNSYNLTFANFTGTNMTISNSTLTTVLKSSTVILSVNQTTYRQGTAATPLQNPFFGIKIFIPFEANYSSGAGAPISDGTCSVTSNNSGIVTPLAFNITTGNFTAELDDTTEFDNTTFNVSCTSPTFPSALNTTTANIFWFNFPIETPTNISFGSAGNNLTNASTWLSKIEPNTTNVLNKTFNITLAPNATNMTVAEIFFCGSNTKVNCSFLRDFNMLGTIMLRINLSASVNNTCMPQLCYDLSTTNLNLRFETCGIAANATTDPQVFEQNVTSNTTIGQSDFLSLRIRCDAGPSINVTTPVNLTIYYNYSGEPASIEIHHPEPQILLSQVVARTQTSPSYTIGPNENLNITMNYTTQFNNSFNGTRFLKFFEQIETLQQFKPSIIPNATIVYNSSNLLWASDNASLNATKTVMVTAADVIIYDTETFQPFAIVNETQQVSHENAIRDNESLILNTTLLIQWQALIQTIFLPEVHIENITGFTNYSAYVPAPDADFAFFVNLTNSSGTFDVTNESIVNRTAKTITFPNQTLSNVTFTITALNVSAPNITIVKTAFPDPVVAGSQLNYSIVVNNTGNSTAFNVTLIEFYPSGVAFSNSSPVPSSGNDTFFLGNLTPNQSTTVNITVNVGSATVGIINNTVNVTFSNSSSQNVTVSTTTNTTVTPFVPPPPPPSGSGGGSGGGPSTSICPNYCRDPQYANVAICQSAACVTAREVLPVPQAAPFSGIKPKPTPEALAREDLRKPVVETKTEVVQVKDEAETNMLKRLMSGISDALASANVKIRMLTVALILAVIALIVVAGLWGYKEYRKKNVSK